MFSRIFHRIAVKSLFLGRAFCSNITEELSPAAVKALSPSADSVAVVATADSAIARAEEISTRLKVPLVDLATAQKTAKWTLCVSEKGLHLQDENPKHGLIRGNFEAGRNNHRRHWGEMASSPLMKSVTVKGLPLQETKIVDATAALGDDAFIFACFGARVTLIERHPVMFELLADAHKRGLEDLRSDSDNVPDVVYMDPMYPVKKRQTALPRKEMMMSRSLVGSDRDSQKLLEIAIQRASVRVVVKRPLKAPSVEGPKPQTYRQSRSTRYDIYNPAIVAELMKHAQAKLGEPETSKLSA